MQLYLTLVCLLQSSAALKIPSSINRRAALASGAASVLPLFAAGEAALAITDYAAKDFKDGVYVGPSVVGAAPTAEDEAKLEALYLEAVDKQQKVVQGMGFDLEDKDKKEIEMMVCNQYCGFQAKLKCKGSPAAKNGGR